MCCVQDGTKSKSSEHGRRPGDPLMTANAAAAATPTVFQTVERAEAMSSSRIATLQFGADA